ncbi:hypothetical protein [Chryseobacterium sp. CP-77]|uniref:hypothetical protein n=1 Tax=Chryseobacterium sp. CP-77 TaxID=3116594 RepID=UPI002ED5588B
MDWNIIPGIISAVGSLATVIVAYYQLSNLNKSLTANNLMTIFEIEFELNRRKERLSEIRNENEKFIHSLEEQPSSKEKEILKVLDSHRKEAFENYLNVFDRLCYFVIKKKLDEDDFKLEYRDMLFKTIEDDQEGTFQTGTKCRNMKRLYNKWKEE